jgi:hypothetical protein
MYRSLHHVRVSTKSVAWMSGLLIRAPAAHINAHSRYGAPLAIGMAVHGTLSVVLAFVLTTLSTIIVGLR